MEDALDRGTISWEGLARNVEYLGMGSEVKMFLGRWYGEWRRDQEDLLYDVDEDEEMESDDEDDDASYDSEDSEDDYGEDRQSSATSVLGADHLQPGDDDDKMDLDLDDLDSLEDIERELPPTRGRNRNTRRLGHATSDPMLQASVPSAHFQSFSSLPRGQSH